jgi:hypothetical protein
MVSSIRNWKDKEIRVVKSKGGKISVCDYRDNLIIPVDSTWPHPDIVKKLYQSNHVYDFDEPERHELTRELGFYCDLQSLRSEDAITWSVFGTLHYFSKKYQIYFVNSLLDIVGVKLTVNDCFIELWTRIAHPDTLVSGGPELDIQIVCANLVIFGEAKWLSKVAEGQGKKKDKDQLQLRREFMSMYGSGIFPKASKRLVLCIELLETDHKDRYNITWAEICNKTRHPLKNEITDYYLWKEKNGQ